MTTARSGTDVSAFQRLALSLPDVVEMSHMGAADFRIQRGDKLRIFATLAYAAKGLGTLMLAAEQQSDFLKEMPEYFSAAPGGWGRMGATLVRLDAPEQVLAGALETAYRQVLGKMLPKTKKRA
jgi:hypothetical protein